MGKWCLKGMLIILICVLLAFEIYAVNESSSELENNETLVENLTENQSNEEIELKQPKIQLKSELYNETLEIKNLGDMAFNGSITVNLGDYVIIKKRILKSGESIKINLRQEVKPGLYNIEVLPTNEVFNNVLISRSDFYYYLSYWKYVIIVVVVLFLLWKIYRKFKDRSEKSDEYIEIKGDKKKFIIESSKKPKFNFSRKNKEEFFIIGKGDKPKPPESGGVMGMFD